MTAYEPTGENQLYTGMALSDMWTFEEAKGADLVFVRQMAIDAFQSVLDNFPDSVSYLADGVTFFPLAPLPTTASSTSAGSRKPGEVTDEYGETTVTRRGCINSEAVRQYEHVQSSFFLLTGCDRALGPPDTDKSRCVPTLGNSRRRPG